MTTARYAGALALFALLAGFTRADEKDPEHDGKKMTQWITAATQGGGSARQRALAVDALGKIAVKNKSNHKDIIPVVGQTLRNDTSAAVRVQAALVLGTLTEKEIEEYGKADLIFQLGKEKESRVKKEIITAISRFPQVCVGAVDPLSEALKDAEPAVKIAAAEALALAAAKTKGSAKSAAAGLAPMLKDPDKAVRTAGIYALGRIQPEGATAVAETLATMLGTETDVNIKRELIVSIGLLGEKTLPVVQALAAALNEKQPDEVRRAAARALGTFGTGAAAAADVLLNVVMTDKLKDVRVDAVRAFGSALGPTGVKARLNDLRLLLDPTKEPDFEVRLALVDEIASLGWEHIGSDIAPLGQVATAVVSFGLLGWSDFDARATLLLKWAEAQKTLVALRLRQADPQGKVREAATLAIRKIEKKPEPKKDPEKKEP